MGFSFFFFPPANNVYGRFTSYRNCLGIPSFHKIQLAAVNISLKVGDKTIETVT